MSAGSSIFADLSSSRRAWISTKPSAAYAPPARNRFGSPYSARDSSSGRTSNHGSDRSKPRWEMHLSAIAIERKVHFRMTDPILLTPGPLTTSTETKTAMLSDWGSWDGAFNAMTASVCRDLLAILHAQADHGCVPLQCSGTFAVEAALGTLVPKHGQVLVPDNGAYCKRIARILKYQGREAVVLPHDEQEPSNPERIDARLTADPSIPPLAQVD